MKRLLRPRVLVPAILAIAIIAAFFAFADLRAVGTLIMRFPRLYVLWFLLQMVAYPFWSARWPVAVPGSNTRYRCGSTTTVRGA